MAASAAENSRRDQPSELAGGGFQRTIKPHRGRAPLRKMKRRVAAADQRGRQETHVRHVAHPSDLLVLGALWTVQRHSAAKSLPGRSASNSTISGRSGTPAARISAVSTHRTRGLTAMIPGVTPRSISFAAIWVKRSFPSSVNGRSASSGHRAIAVGRPGVSENIEVHATRGIGD